MEDCNLLHSITADRGISDHEETKDFFFFQNIAKIDKNVANTNFCNIFVAKKCCMKFRVSMTCCKAQCCKLFGEKINVAKAYVANILANQQCCKHKITKNVAKKNLSEKITTRDCACKILFPFTTQSFAAIFFFLNFPKKMLVC